MPPKTASNSIKKALKDSGVEFDKTPYPELPDIHLFLSEILSLYGICPCTLEDYKIVQVVRNPHERFASSYYHQLRILKNIETNLNGLNFEEFTLHLKDSLLSKKEFFERFYGRVDFIEKMINSGKSWGGTRLYLNQTQWDDKGVDIKYFKIENLSNDITPLSEYLGIDLKPLPKVNVHKTSENYDELYNDETRKIVNDIYYNDFQALGY